MFYIEISTIIVWSISSIFIRITYFSFCEIFNSEQYRVIICYSLTPGRQVSVRSCRYYEIQLLPWLLSFIDRLYRITYFSFCEICNSEKYRVIIGYSPTPGRQVSARLFRYYSIQLLPWLILFVDRLYYIIANMTGQA